MDKINPYPFVVYAYKMKRPFFIFAVILSVLILLFRFFGKESHPPGRISNFVSEKGRNLAIKGIVASDPYYKEAYFRTAQIFIVRPELVKVSKIWYPAYGNIRVKSYGRKELRYGDEILFEAALRAPYAGEESTFDYRKYLEIRNIYALAAVSERDPVIVTGNKAPPLKSFAYNLKDLLQRRLEGLFRSPERHFLSAILLGERQHIPGEWNDVFKKTQTMHLLAISGLHVGIIGFIMLFFFGLFGLPRNFRYIITALLLVFYAVMVGGRPSVLRATVMAVTILGSYVLKREADIYNSLGLAAAVILMFNPDELFDYGFILSFISVLSIVYIVPRIKSALGIERVKRPTLWGGLVYNFFVLGSASIAVWVGLLPLNVNFFNVISPVSVFVNILAIPLLFIIIAFSISSLIFYPVFSLLGTIFGEATQFFIAILLSFLRMSSNLPMAFLDVESIGTGSVILYYFVLVIVIEHKRLRPLLTKVRKMS